MKLLKYVVIWGFENVVILLKVNKLFNFLLLFNIAYSTKRFVFFILWVFEAKWK